MFGFDFNQISEMIEKIQPMAESLVKSFAELRAEQMRQGEVQKEIYSMLKHLTEKENENV